MFEKIVIGLMVLGAAVYLLRRVLKKGSGCGCASGGCSSGGCGGEAKHKPLDLSSCACHRRDG